MGQVGAETHQQHHGAALLLLAEGSKELGEKTCYDMDRLGQNGGKTHVCLRVNGKLPPGQQFSTQSPVKTPLPWAGGDRRALQRDWGNSFKCDPFEVNLGLEREAGFSPASSPAGKDDGLQLCLSKLIGFATQNKTGSRMTLRSPMSNTRIRFCFS